MNILFLDYDGVLNTPMWKLNEAGKLICTYNSPSDNAVNNFQACQWVSEFCEKYNYSIVVTSTWRLHDNYINCLRNGGLRKNIKVLGGTKEICDYGYFTRSEEIKDWIETHKGVENFIILDDEELPNVTINIKGKKYETFDGHFVLCRQDCGFNLTEFTEAEKLHKIMEKLK